MNLAANYRPLTITSGIHLAGERTPRNIAIRESGRTLTFSELSAHITALAGRLVLCGFERGDRVAVLAPNCLEYPELVCGIADAGMVAVTLNPRAHVREINDILLDSGARALIVHPHFDELAARLEAPLIERRIAIDESYAAWRDTPTRPVELPAVSEFDPFVLVYTSGTTGRAKGVLLPHRARALQFLSMALEYGCYGPNDRFLGLAPMALGAGFGFGMCVVFFGGHLEIVPQFDAATILDKLVHEGITGMFVVPSHLHAIFALPATTLERYRGKFAHLKTIISNAAALPLAIKEKTVDYWGDKVLHETYGFTEAGIVTNLKPEDQLRKPGSVGSAFHLCDVRLLNDDGEPVPRGEVGELFASSPYLFNGYWHRPEETEACMRGRWLSAGDLARQDEDGCYYIVDRKKDMVVSGGLNIYPREIEGVLDRHPAVAECAVIGLPDERWGERLRACLVLKPHGRVTSEEIQAFCRQYLADYKVPRDVAVVSELPRNANGKVLKRLLKDAPAGAPPSVEVNVYKSLKLNIRDRVAYVEFSTPEQLNSISEQRITDLEHVVALVRRDESIRALTLTGSGRAFCVGLDLELLKKAFADLKYFESVVRRLQRVLLDMEALTVPVIAAVNGIARAGGFETILACDLVVVADEAKIGDRHTHLGLLPGGGCSPRLPRLVGEQRAKAILMLARWMSGPEAVRTGLALRSVPLAELPAAVEDLLSELRHRPRECMGGIKRALQSARTLEVEQAVEFEIQTFVDYLTRFPYGREGYEASLSDRLPNWY